MATTKSASLVSSTAPPLPGTQRITVTRGITAPALQVDAVPDPECSTCHGKGTIIALRHGARVETACPCAKRRAARFAKRIDDAERVAPLASSEAPDPPVSAPQRVGQLARLRAAIADLERQRDESLADHDGWVATATGAEASAADALDGRRLGIERLRADAAERREQAVGLRRQADALDCEAKHLLSAAAEIERRALPPLAATKARAVTALAEAQTERERVAKHFDRRLSPLRARESRIARRIGPGT